MTKYTPLLFRLGRDMWSLASDLLFTTMYNYFIRKHVYIKTQPAAQALEHIYYMLSEKEKMVWISLFIV